MSNQRLAYRYAKSLVDISIEKNQLEAVFADIQYIKAVCKGSKDFSNLLASPIIKADKKETIINAVFQNNIGTITTQFNKLLVSKGREGDMLAIAESFSAQYNEIKGILIVKLTTAVAISDELKASIENKVSAANSKAIIQLETKVDENIIGGFLLEFDNKLVDASILRDLNDVKKQFLKNYYVPAII